MRISDIQLAGFSDSIDELSADVRIEKPRPENYRVWFRGPRGCFGDGPLGDVYFAAFWIPAMFLQEDFAIDGEISGELLDAAYEKLEPLFIGEHGGTLRPAPVQGHRRIEKSLSASSGHGCLFSGGIDSAYSTIKNYDSLTHLVFIHGFEIPWRRDDLINDALSILRPAADELNREIIVIKSNLQDPIQDLTMRSPELGRPDPAFFLKYYFGSMLVCVNLCLRGILGKVLIPSSWGSQARDILGSNPRIEPNWSTSTMTFDLDGVEADRIDKISYLIEKRPEVFRWLRVCTRPPGKGIINCGRCGKCTRTMMEMRIAGAGAELYSNFQHRLDIKCVSRRVVSFGDQGLAEDLRQRARKADDQEVLRAIEIIQGERFYLPRFRDQVIQKFNGWRKSRRTAKRSRRKLEGRKKGSFPVPAAFDSDE